MNCTILLNMKNTPSILYSVDNKYDIQVCCIDDVNTVMYNHTSCVDINQTMSCIYTRKPDTSDYIDTMYSDNISNDTRKLYHIIYN